MPGREKRDAYVPQLERLSPGMTVVGRRLPNPRCQERKVLGCSVIVAGARPGMVGMRMRDNGPADRTKRVNPEIAGWTVQAAGIRAKKVCAIHEDKSAA